MESDHLKDAGLKITESRLLILNLFQQNPSQHLGADDLFIMLKKSKQTISLATIYRTLASLEQVGLLLKHHFNEGAVYELHQKEHHDHLVCTACGEVEEFVDPVIESKQLKIAQEKGYQLTDHRLTLYGICRNCQK
jgi:Fur family ferric uptake transcriptional regulator